MASLDNVRILCFVGDDYEDLELWYPKLRLEEAGAHVVYGLVGFKTRQQMRRQEWTMHWSFFAQA